LIARKDGGAGHDFIFFKMRKEGMHVSVSVRQYLALAEDSIFVKLLSFWDKQPVKERLLLFFRNKRPATAKTIVHH